MNPRTNSVDFRWPIAHQIPPLLAGEVQIYAWELTTPPQPRDWETLSKVEAERARRFVFPRDRDHYVRAHSIMRRLLSQHSGIPPAELSFTSGPYGKPQMAVVASDSGGNPDPENGPMDPLPLQFNLTHSGGIAALAVAREYSLGIDVERIRAIGSDIAESHFSPSERNTLKTLPPARWLDGFYRCWTAKEALLKGLGLGLNLPLDSFDVETDPRRDAALLAWRPPADFAHGWRLFAVNPAPRFAGTMAVQDDTGGFAANRLQCFSLDSGSL